MRIAKRAEMSVLEPYRVTPIDLPLSSSIFDTVPMITIGVVLSATATNVTSIPATPAASIAGPPICDIWISPDTRVCAMVEPLRM